MGLPIRIDEVDLGGPKHGHQGMFHEFGPDHLRRYDDEFAERHNESKRDRVD